MAVCNPTCRMKLSAEKPSAPHAVEHMITTMISSFKPVLRELQHIPIKIDVQKTLKNTSIELLDAFVDKMFKFVDQPYLETQVTSQHKVIITSHIYCTLEELGSIFLAVQKVKMVTCLLSEKFCSS
ncbi:hypothetical protein DCAR_0103296 [Daucus carota subsp. sativus]|uniref:Uncharacterized protein n=1 Tax=Daucus carota subsp. sativus TaxID=79200 RepID=A0AAF0W9W6_DAUCS|nr:hypothetical protein DCAR_0103296 [Daucus carota subsp. sativus]